MTTPAPIINALAPWFGGKRTLASAIVAELGPHTQYFEPFAGGCSIIFAKPKAQKETLSDLHGDITNLARVVVSAYDCPRYRELYAGWTFTKHTMPKLLHQQNGKSTPKVDAPEVLIVNGPSFGAPA